jgi:hypothetical protein
MSSAAHHTRSTGHPNSLLVTLNTANPRSTKNVSWANRTAEEEADRVIADAMNAGSRRGGRGGRKTRKRGARAGNTYY